MQLSNYSYPCNLVHFTIYVPIKLYLKDDYIAVKENVAYDGKNYRKEQVRMDLCTVKNYALKTNLKCVNGYVKTNQMKPC